MKGTTFGDRLHEPAHRSFFRDRLLALAGGQPLDEWLVEQANVRGFRGAVGREERAPVEPSVSAEDLAVALLMPHGDVDVRVFKLVLRMIQSGRLDLPRLVLRARRERADRMLWWLVERVPEEERDGEVQRLEKLLSGPPRGYRAADIVYEPSRLIRRPFRGFR